MTKRTRSVEHRASNEYTTPRPTFIGTALLVALLVAVPAQAQTPVVEATNADEATVLQVNEDGGLLGLGVLGMGVIPVEGEGVRLMWHPAKAAFRAGRIGFFTDGSEWDEANVGLYSTAFGVDATASGFASMAIGRSTIASGNFSTAMGAQTTASGLTSTAMGNGTTASGNNATAMGADTEASGFAATAMSHDTKASGNRSTAMGEGTTAQARSSLIIGQFNVVEGNPTTWVPTDPLFVAGNGSSTASRSNALTLFKDGNLTIAGDLTENSDRRLKTDIAPLGSALDRLLALDPVRYRFKDGTRRPEGPQLGLIAQEVERAFPELVTHGSDGYLSVAYPKLTAVLLKGLQEQQAQMEAQRQEIEALQAANASIQQRLVQLEASFAQSIADGNAASPAFGETRPPPRRP